jgi:hypothetical protein
MPALKRALAESVQSGGRGTVTGAEEGYGIAAR